MGRSRADSYIGWLGQPGAALRSAPAWMVGGAALCPGLGGGRRGARPRLGWWVQGREGKPGQSEWASVALGIPRVLPAHCQETPLCPVRVIAGGWSRSPQRAAGCRVIPGAGAAGGTNATAPATTNILLRRVNMRAYTVIVKNAMVEKLSCRRLCAARLAKPCWPICGRREYGCSRSLCVRGMFTCWPSCRIPCL